MRAPWPIQEIRRYDRRARLLAVAPTELLTRDKKNLVVESVVLWRVSDPQLFLESVGGPEQAELQLGDLATSRIAAALGQREFGEMLNTEQGGGELLPAALVAELASTAQSRLGVEVIAVQLKHFGFPLQTEASIYERMRAERSRIANAYRSEGEEKAATIRAEAERQAAEIGAEAERQAASIQAEAEEAAARLYAEAWATNPALYRSLRELEAAEAALGQDDLLVISTDDPLLRGLRGP
jgi:membrane protease subunit HflC